MSSASLPSCALRARSKEGSAWMIADTADPRSTPKPIGAPKTVRKTPEEPALAARSPDSLAACP